MEGIDKVDNVHINEITSDDIKNEHELNFKEIIDSFENKDYDKENEMHYLKKLEQKSDENILSEIENMENITEQIKLIDKQNELLEKKKKNIDEELKSNLNNKNKLLEQQNEILKKIVIKRDIKINMFKENKEEYTIKCFKDTSLNASSVTSSSTPKNAYTSICTNYAKGRCILDNRCTFVHINRGQDMRNKYRQICKFFPDGKCEKEDCGYIHTKFPNQFMHLLVQK